MSVLKSLNGDGRYGLALALCLLALLVPLAGGEPLRLAWRYERFMLEEGQWWRWLTAHLVHLDAWHAVLNAAGLMLLWALFARSYRPGQWLLAVLLCVLVIDAGLWWLSPQLQWYVGASAVLHGLFACGCIAMLRRGDRAGWIAAGVFIAKILWEQWQGPLPFSSGHPVVTASHAYGAAGGALAGLLLRPAREPVY